MAVFRRKKYFVDRTLQMRFASVVIFFTFVTSVLTGGAIFLTTFLLMGEKLMAVYPQARIAQIFQSVYLWAFISFVAVMPFVVWGSIVFSHRVAGPLPKIYQALKHIGAGNFEIKLTLRKHDELKDLADNINAMARALKEREIKK